VLISIGSAYGMMLQIAIYPYLICSLLLGLGRLSPDMSRRFLGATLREPHRTDRQIRSRKPVLKRRIDRGDSGSEVGRVRGASVTTLVHQLFPRASVKIVPNYDSLPELGDKVDAAVWTLEQASAWAAAHPGYTAVQPSGLGAPIPFAFLFPPGVSDFREYVDQWLALEGTDGFRSTQIGCYWIDGKPRVVAKPRWNLWDVLAAQIKKQGRMNNRTGEPQMNADLPR
jgi:hypothetical protein